MGTASRTRRVITPEGERALHAGPPLLDPAAYGILGKVYDGWETHRRPDGVLHMMNVHDVID